MRAKTDKNNAFVNKDSNSDCLLGAKHYWNAKISYMTIFTPESMIIQIYICIWEISIALRAAPIAPSNFSECVYGLNCFITSTTDIIIWVVQTTDSEF